MTEDIREKFSGMPDEEIEKVVKRILFVWNNDIRNLKPEEVGIFNIGCQILSERRSKKLSNIMKLLEGK